MIRPLRLRHRWSFMVLALALPGILIAALAQRSPDPVAPASEPPIPGTAAGSGGAGGWSALGPALARRGGGADRAWVEVIRNAETAGPDLHLYWVPPDSGPIGGRYLGPLPAARSVVFTLDAAEAENGELVLYSLAHREVVARARPAAPRSVGGGS